MFSRPFRMLLGFQAVREYTSHKRCADSPLTYMYLEHAQTGCHIRYSSPSSMRLSVVPTNVRARSTAGAVLLASMVQIHGSSATHVRVAIDMYPKDSSFQGKP